jgi:hypothetical protein
MPYIFGHYLQNQPLCMCDFALARKLRGAHTVELSKAEPRFFTLTKRDMAKFCHRHMREIYVMDQNNSVFLNESGFIQSEMGIL